MPEKREHVITIIIVKEFENSEEGLDWVGENIPLDGEYSVYCEPREQTNDGVELDEIPSLSGR